MVRAQRRGPYSQNLPLPQHVHVLLVVGRAPVARRNIAVVDFVLLLIHARVVHRGHRDVIFGSHGQQTQLEQSRTKGRWSRRAAFRTPARGSGSGCRPAILVLYARTATGITEQAVIGEMRVPSRLCRKAAWDKPPVLRSLGRTDSHTRLSHHSWRGAGLPCGTCWGVLPFDTTQRLRVGR
jgi:hypothetical protein